MIETEDVLINASQVLVFTVEIVLQLINEVDHMRSPKAKLGNCSPWTEHS